MIIEPALRDELLAAIPHLRAFAVSLTYDGNRPSGVTDCSN
jgi:hypothetical protein